jgi:translation initiation factor 5A
MARKERGVIESAISSAPAKFQMVAAWKIERGGYMVIDGKPCRVLSRFVYPPGKSGHTAIRFSAVDFFTGKKHTTCFHSTYEFKVPIVDISNWVINDIDGKALILFNDLGTQKRDLKLPTHPVGMANEICDAWDNRENIVEVTVQSALGSEQIVAWKKIDY